METSHAIILAATIIVGGLWSGKLIYDYIQEQRLKAALIEVAEYMDEALKDLDKSIKQMPSDMQKRAALEDRTAQQRRTDADEKRLEEIARVQQEKISICSMPILAAATYKKLIKAYRN